MLSRILAIDYGEKRIGLALSDALRMFAKPYLTLPNTTYDEVLSQLQTVIKEQQVGDIIVGVPWSINGNPTARTNITNKFITRLAQDMQIPVTGWDERYSSQEANTQLKNMGYNWKEARKQIDAMAACLILKSYMESNAS